MTFRLDDFLPYQLSVAASEISRRFAARYASEAGLSIPEWRGLAHLSRDITGRVNLEKSVVSRAASRLQEAGYVTKVGHGVDRRLIVLELTGEGEALMARLARLAEEFQAELKAELGADADAFARAMRTIVDRS